MSWESTAVYYRLLNELVRERLGGLHSADCIVRSVDFASVEQLQRDGAWDVAGARLAGEARALEAAGAELVVLCTNTMHKVADEIAAGLSAEFVHIADATAQCIRTEGLRRVGLLGTAYTMEQDFYVGRLRDRHELDVIVPGDAERRVVHDVIYDELCQGVVSPSSKAAYRTIIASLEARGADAIILGCTEIGLLVDGADASVPMFDTTEMHVQEVVARAVSR
jgi:aspartate racemase